MRAPYSALRRESMGFHLQVRERAVPAGAVLGRDVHVRAAGAQGLCKHQLDMADPRAV